MSQNSYWFPLRCEPHVRSPPYHLIEGKERPHEQLWKGGTHKTLMTRLTSHRLLLDTRRVLDRMGFYLFMGITVNTRLLLFSFFFRLMYVHSRWFLSGVEWRRRGQRETKWATNLLVLSVSGCSSGGTLKEQQVKVWGILMDECLSRRRQRREGIYRPFGGIPWSAVSVVPLNKLITDRRRRRNFN